MTEEPIRALTKELTEAHKLYLEPCPDDEDLGKFPYPKHPQRQATSNALDAAIRFVLPQVPAELCVPLVHLRAALEDLDNGKQAGFLKPRAIPGRGHRMPLMNDVLFAMAAAGVTLLIQSGDKKITALRMAAKKLGTDSKALDRWRRNRKSRSLLIQKFYYEIIANELEKSYEYGWGVSENEAIRRTGTIILEKVEKLRVHPKRVRVPPLLPD